MKQQQELVYISDYRCRLDNKNRIIINIGSNERIMAGVKVTGTIDGKSLPVDVIYRNTIRSRFCYRNINNKFNREYQVCADVNNNFKTLQITLKFAGDNEGVVKTITIPGKRFRKNCDRIQGCVDVCKKTDEGCKIEGWAADAKEVKIKVLCDGKELTGDFRRVFRQDIADYYQDGETSVPLGYTFDIINNSKDIKKVRLYIIRMIASPTSNLTFPNQAKKYTAYGCCKQSGHIYAQVWFYRYVKKGLQKDNTQAYD